MQFNPTQLALLLSLLTPTYALSRSGGPVADIEVEVQAPSSGFPMSFTITVATDKGASSSATYGSYLALPPKLSVLSESFLLDRPTYEYCFLLVEERRPTRTLVWRLPNSPSVGAAWTHWRRPDFLENSDRGWWNLVHDRDHQQRSKAVPNDSYRARYRYVGYPRPKGHLVPVRPRWPTVTPTP